MSMSAGGKIELPDSGLAEDILASFVFQAQTELDRVAECAERRDAGESFHLVSFALGREWYGVGIENVQEIIRAERITRVPGAPGHVRGVINLRGRIIPVVDLRVRLGLAAPEGSEERRIVVVELGPKRLGLLVDAVSQVLRVPAALVEELPEEAGRVEARYLRGVGMLEGRLIFMLDLARTLLLAD